MGQRLMRVVIDRDAILLQAKLSAQIPTLVEGILARHVITDTAQHIGLQVEAEELQQATQQMQQIHQLPTEKEVETWLVQHGLSTQEFTISLRTNVLANKLAKHLFNHQVEPYFYAHQLDYTQAVLHEIMLDNLDLATELYYAIREKEVSFAEMARQYTQDDDLRRIGGYKGALHRNQLKPEIAAAVFAAQPPQLLKPIAIAKSVHLIFVETILHLQLDESLYQHLLSQFFREWLQSQVHQLSSTLKLSIE
jgi:parvulin-like peptidyl-prolyl isomerase